MEIETTKPQNGFHKLLISAAIPCFFMLLAWIVFILEKTFHLDLSVYGLFPRQLANLYGILTMPFIHGDLGHIFNNTISFIPLGILLFYFYPKHAWKIFGISYLFCGILTWIIGRSSYHIGASAMIYAFAAYIFTCGVKSRNRKLLAVSLIVVFVCGGMIWGIFPQNTGISWEGHLSGAVVGVVLAFIYKIPRPIPLTNNTTELLYTKFTINDYDSTENSDVEVNYFYKQELKNNNDNKQISKK
jgi:membrane associated rhomboid family serine protease